MSSLFFVNVVSLQLLERLASLDLEELAGSLGSYGMIQYAHFFSLSPSAVPGMSPSKSPGSFVINDYIWGPT
ncbi:hypothetical protein V1509DRAFT_618468 [Lipomyces kononenkoae]